MGWGRSAVYSHAQRLLDSGLAATVRLPHGEGSLIYATRDGVGVAAVQAMSLACGSGADDVGAL